NSVSGKDTGISNGTQVTKITSVRLQAVVDNVTYSVPLRQTYTDAELRALPPIHISQSELESFGGGGFQALTASAGSLVGHWKPDATTGTVAADASGKSLGGTVTGAGWSANGQDQGALYLDGNNDDVT